MTVQNTHEVIWGGIYEPGAVKFKWITVSGICLLEECVGLSISHTKNNVSAHLFILYVSCSIDN